jgi:integrase
MPIHTDSRNGRLFVQFDYKKQTFKQYLPAGSTLTQARKLETKMRSDAFFQANGMAPKDETLFEDCVQEYLAHIQNNPGKYERAEIVLIAAKPFLKGKFMRSITPTDIERFMNYRAAAVMTFKVAPDKLRKPATIWREVSVISALFTFAIKNRDCEVNPCQQVDKPVFDNTQDKVLDRELDETFLANFDPVEGIEARDAAHLVLHTGLSQKDLLGLTDFNINRTERMITLTRGKTKRPYKVPLNAPAWEIVGPRLGHGLLFRSSKTGGQMRSIRTAVASACRRAKIEPVTMLDLRRTFATRLAEDGVDALTIALLLGHADLRMVHRYARSVKAMRQAVENLDKPTQDLPAQSVRFSK